MFKIKKLKHSDCNLLFQENRGRQVMNIQLKLTLINKLLQIIISVLAIGFTLPLSAVEKKEEGVNRKVLILDFVNTQRSPDYAYLESTIPDAFMEPLEKTKVFELLPRSLWSEFISSKGFKKEEAWMENKAVKAGQEGNSDVVVIGSFAVVKDKMHIFSKAIEVASGRVIISRSKSSNIDGTMFDAISGLANEMSADMKDKLPPLKQKVVTKERVIDTSKVTFGGMIWRNAILPGLGHVYAHQWRGWVYLSLFVGTAGLETWFILDADQKQNDYKTAISDLQTKYDAANQANLMAGYGIIGLAVLYAIPFVEILITGKKYDESVVSMVNHRSLLSFSMSPESGKNLSGNMNYNIAFHKYF